MSVQPVFFKSVLLSSSKVLLDLQSINSGAGYVLDHSKWKSDCPGHLFSTHGHYTLVKTRKWMELYLSVTS